MNTKLFVFMVAAHLFVGSCARGPEALDAPAFGELRVCDVGTTSALLSVEVENVSAAVNLGFIIDDDREVEGESDGGSMELMLKDLVPGTTYTAVAYASNGKNTVRSRSLTFCTLDQFPDPAWRSYLLADFDSDHDGLISQAEADKVTVLAPDDDVRKGLHGTEGLGIFRNLEHIGLGGGWEWTIDMDDIDLSPFSRLRHLYLCWGHFRSIVLPDAVRNMDYIGLDYNEITDIDVRGLQAVTYFQCAHNSLVRLDLRNVARIHLLDVSANPSLEKLILNRSVVIDELRIDDLSVIEYVD